MENALKEGTDVVLSTSRKLITSDDKKRSLEMGNIVSDVLIDIVKDVDVKPKYVIAKVSQHHSFPWPTAALAAQFTSGQTYLFACI